MKIQTCSLECYSDKHIQTLKEDIVCVQYEKFKKYNCYYCDREIKSEPVLNHHRLECSGALQFKVLPQKPGHAIKPLHSLPISFPPSKYSQVFPYMNPRMGPLPECVHCGLFISCGTDLAKHMKNVHNDHRSPFEVYK